MNFDGSGSSGVEGPKVNWSEHFKKHNEFLNQNKFLTSNFLYSLPTQKPKPERHMDTARYTFLQFFSQLKCFNLTPSFIFSIFVVCAISLLFFFLFLFFLCSLNLKICNCLVQFCFVVFLFWEWNFFNKFYIMDKSYLCIYY